MPDDGKTLKTYFLLAYSSSTPQSHEIKSQLQLGQTWAQISATMSSQRPLNAVATALAMASSAVAFAPSSQIASSISSVASRTSVVSNLAVDPTSLVDAIDTTSSVLSTGGANAEGIIDGVTTTLSSAAASVSASSTNLLSFADQGQNLAGIFFQASLLPYLTFLYFLSFRGNRIPALGNFGWQFLLLFVLSTIPGGIISKSVYGTSLADCDWLHGSAEALLTITNVLIVSLMCLHVCFHML